VRKLLLLLLAPMAACATSGGPAGEPRIVPRPKARLAKAGILPGASLPSERDGVHADDTGPILFICANSDKHEDKEVFFMRCLPCGQENYFYWDHARYEYRCFACAKAVDPETVRCPDCGRPPRVWRTRPKAKPS